MLQFNIVSPILLAERADFLVVAKPPDLLSHPTRPDGTPTLLGWLQEKFPGEFVALVNRLDRETSGTVLVARTPEVASRLGAMTMRREIVKHYLALVFGRVASEHAVIDAPTGRLGISKTNPIWLRRASFRLTTRKGAKPPTRARNIGVWPPATPARSCAFARTRDGCTSSAFTSRTSDTPSSAIRSMAPIRVSTSSSSPRDGPRSISAFSACRATRCMRTS